MEEMTGEGMRELAGALGEVERSGEALQGAWLRLVGEFQHGAASLRTEWRRAVDDMVQQAARLLDGVNGLQGLGSTGGEFGAVGRLLAWAGGAGRPHRVSFEHPAVPLPEGGIRPGSLAGLAARGTPAVTVQAGAVQISAQTVDERALAQAAELLAERIHARLAFEDRRLGRL